MKTRFPLFARLLLWFFLNLLVLLAGVALFARALWIWWQANFGDLPPAENLRRLVPAVTLIILGVQAIFSSFFMSALGLKTQTRKPPSPS